MRRPADKYPHGLGPNRTVHFTSNCSGSLKCWGPYQQVQTIKQAREAAELEVDAFIPQVTGAGV
ncbi:MAG TPA: hypothetical protein VJ250_08010 [Nitrososphaeraceae archaeon]|nr:hypothetical protein [Nitrososphaeraceae archaeon]